MRIRLKYLMPPLVLVMTCIIGNAAAEPRNGDVIDEPRIGLVIGNGAYSTNPLSDPPNDADLIADSLSSLGFDVTKHKNVNQKEMKRLISDFGKRLKRDKSAVGLFYYSGHGMQVNGRNYMIPIGAEIEEEDDVDPESVSMNNVLTRMESARNHLNIIILDACRTNRFEKSFKQQAEGLNKMEAPRGSFMAFAAEPHRVAIQGKGSYSVFTEALADTLREPGLYIEQVFKEVRKKVQVITDDKQVPTTESKLTADFVFNTGIVIAPIEISPSWPVPEMVPIAAGSFWMGSEKQDPDADSDEFPRHRVTIEHAFEIGKYEVTFEQYDAFADETGRDRPRDKSWGRAQRPVINVSWSDARDYAAWLSEKTGKNYRLPTESEWEYAARANSETLYSWGDAISHQFANYGDNTCCKGRAHGRDKWVHSAPVGQFDANRFGLFDMHGNVWEWVEDCYTPNYDEATKDGSAREQEYCSERVLRGGSWFNEPQSLRSANRNKKSPDSRFNNFGFRLARTL